MRNEKSPNKTSGLESQHIFKVRTMGHVIGRVAIGFTAAGDMAMIDGECTVKQINQINRMSVPGMECGLQDGRIVCVQEMPMGTMHINVTCQTIEKPTFSEL